jgi:hypothetical protein
MLASAARRRFTRNAAQHVTPTHLERAEARVATKPRCRVRRKRALGRPTSDERAFARVARADVHDLTLEPTCGAGSRGAPFARAHDRSPFRARCRRRDAARAGGDPIANVEASRRITFFGSSLFQVGKARESPSAFGRCSILSCRGDATNGRLWNAVAPCSSGARSSASWLPTCDSAEALFPTLDHFHCPPGETKLIARRFNLIADDFQLSSR